MPYGFMSIDEAYRRSNQNLRRDLKDRAVTYKQPVCGRKRQAASFWEGDLPEDKILGT